MRIDTPQIAFVAFQSGVPELAIDPGDSRDKAVGLDGAKNRAGVGIDLMDLPIPILPHPERAFGPGESRTGAIGRRNCAEHAAGVRIDLLDAVAGKLEQVATVESRSCMRGDIDRADLLPALGIKCVQLVSRREPDVLTVIGDPSDAFDAGKGTVFAKDFGCRSVSCARS